MKKTTQKKCPHCSSLHVHNNNAAGFSTSQYWQPDERNEDNSGKPIYNCRNCGMKFFFLGY